MLKIKFGDKEIPFDFCNGAAMDFEEECGESYQTLVEKRPNKAMVYYTWFGIKHGARKLKTKPPVTLQDIIDMDPSSEESMMYVVLSKVMDDKKKQKR